MWIVRKLEVCHACGTRKTKIVGSESYEMFKRVRYYNPEHLQIRFVSRFVNVSLTYLKIFKSDYTIFTLSNDILINIFKALFLTVHV